jgi:hypothetical protein
MVVHLASHDVSSPGPPAPVNTNYRDTVFIDEVDEHVTQNIPAFGLLSWGQKVAREIMRIQKRGSHLHWYVPARLLRWALSHSAQMRSPVSASPLVT